MASTSAFLTVVAEFKGVSSTAWTRLPGGGWLSIVARVSEDDER
jgi:hypothetical protein